MLLSLIAVGTAMSGLAAPALADGTPDPTFDGDGRLTRAPSGFSPGENGIGLAADLRGRIVVVGTTVAVINGRWQLPPVAAVFRYLPDGSLDPSFSGDGIDETRLPDRSTTGEAVAIDGSGRILVTGGPTVMRYLSDGTLDKSFGVEGVATVPTHPGILYAAARDVTLDDHDRAVVTAGRSLSCLESEIPEFFAVARLAPDGKLDGTFGGDGLQTLSFPGYAQAAIEAVAVDSAGRVVVGASLRSEEDADFAVARFLPEGALDGSFGDGGRAIVDFGLSARDPFQTVRRERLYDLAIDGSGRILVAGRAAVSGEAVSAVGRLLPDGSPDPAFGEGGRMTFAFPYPSEAMKVVVDGAERPVVAGYISPSSFLSCGLAGKAYVARLGSAGALDASFGAGGILTEDFFQPYAAGSALGVDPQGRYLLGGTVSSDQGTGFGLARYLVDYPPRPGGPLRCNGRKATMVGTRGRDVLVGARKRDVIVAGGGDDTIRSRRGNDVVCGGRGGDLVRGGAGSDRVFGGTGADRLFGQAGRDRLFGAAGADELSGGPGRDLLRGGPGQDRQR